MPQKAVQFGHVVHCVNSGPPEGGASRKLRQEHCGGVFVFAMVGGRGGGWTRPALAMGTESASGLLAVVCGIIISCPSSGGVGIATVGIAVGEAAVVGGGSLLRPHFLSQLHGRRTARSRRVDCRAWENCLGEKKPAPAEHGGELVWKREEEIWLRREPAEESWLFIILLHLK